MSAQQIIFEGWVSILAALVSGFRPVYHLYLQRDKQSPSFTTLEHHAWQHGVPISRVDEAEIAALTRGSTHGGAVALVGPRSYQTLAELGHDVTAPFIVMLDGVEDPFNYGQAVRALYAAGAHGLVVRGRDWGNTAGVVARASAGASERVATAIVHSTEEAFAHFKARGLTVACTSNRGNAHSIYEANLSGPLFLVIGGERRGISRTLIHQADMLLQIPYGGDFRQALDLTSSTAILAFEVLRQRQFKGEAE